MKPYGIYNKKSGPPKFASDESRAEWRGTRSELVKKTARIWRKRARATSKTACKEAE